jgi:Xaa-Pro dipeptidase
MHQAQRQRAQKLLQASGIDRALFADVANVTWLTGFDPPTGFGAQLYAGGPSLVWYEAGEFTLIVLDAHAAGAGSFGDEPNCQVATYLGYTFERPPASADHLAAALREVTGKAGSGKVGVETHRLPAFLWPLLPEGAETVAIDGWLDPLRQVKTGEELAKMRENFALIDLAQAAAREAVQPGRREIDVWLAIQSALQRAAGRTLPLGNDCTVGRRAHGGGPALDVEIVAGDSFVVDLSTQLYGYSSDSCVTYYAGQPTGRQVTMHRTVTEALALAISLVRPGAVAGEIDRRVRQFMAEAGYPVYPHHTGHGIGTRAHELPRIVPYSDEVLQAGMVIMLEPGIYFPDETAIRLEHAVLVTADGAEVLTHYDQSLP